MSDDMPSRKQTVAEYFGALASPGFGLEDAFFLSMGRRLVEFANIPRRGQVLDVAAGRGANLFPAADSVGEGGRVIGIDLAEAMVRRTASEIKSRGLQNTQILQMDAEQLDFDDASFDRVLCGFALFFFPQLDRTLLEASRVLKPGGIFAASSFAPAPDFYPWRWYEELLSSYQISSRFEDLVNLAGRLFTPADFERALSPAGFVNIHIATETYDDMFEDEEDWWRHVRSSADGKLFSDLDLETLRKFREDAFEKLQALRGKDGIRARRQVLLVSGTKSAT